MARITALTDNWWSLFVRLADPSQQTEAITSRPLLLTAPARLTRHGGQTRLTISHPHAEAAWVEAACRIPNKARAPKMDYPPLRIVRFSGVAIPVDHSAFQPALTCASTAFTLSTTV